jgi:hypothetical protein
MDDYPTCLACIITPDGTASPGNPLILKYVKRFPLHSAHISVVKDLEFYLANYKVHPWSFRLVWNLALKKLLRMY